MAKLYDVFISYSQYDEKVKTAMVQYLEDHGITCWYMTGRIDAGDEWRKEITRGIKNSKCFVLIYSSYSKESEQVPKEVALASENKLIMIPFKLENIPFEDDISYEFARIQSINAYEGKMSSHFEELRKTIERYAKDVDETSAPEPSKKSNKNNRKLIYAMIVAAVIVVVAGFAAYAMFSNRSSDNTDSDASETEITEEIIEETAEDEVGEEIDEETDSAEALVEEAVDQEIAAAEEEDTEAEDEKTEDEETEVEEEVTTVSMNIPDDAIEYNGHYYLLYEMGSAIDWEDAEERCEKLGGHLVTVTSAAEQDFLETNVLNSGSNSWLGAYYDEEGIWRWVTDELMCYTDWSQPTKTSSTSYRYLGTLGFSWQNFDETGYIMISARDKQVTGYICEWDVENNVDTEEASRGIEGATIPDDTYEHDGHYYRIYYIGDDMTWEEAEALCETLGGHLATVTSSAEQTYLETNVFADGGFYWLGGYYNTSGDWVWITSEAMGYVQWTLPSKTSSSTYRYMGIMSYDWQNFNETGYIMISARDKQITGYVCEWDAEWSLYSAAENTDKEEDEIVIPDDAVEYEGHSYRVYNSSSDLTWEEAETLCEALGGHLATVTSEEEQTFLKINIYKDGTYYFLGGFYDNSGNWAWVTGEEMDYMQWTEPSEESSLNYRYMGTLNYDWQNFNETGYIMISGRNKQISGYICEWDTTAEAVAAAEAE